LGAKTVIKPGTLVLTFDGYFAIVLTVPEDEGLVGVFACNGLRIAEHEDRLTPLGLRPGSADAEPPAFFGEIIKENIYDQAR